MDERVGKKRSKFDRNKDFMEVQVNDEKDLEHNLEVEPNLEKKWKIKVKKKNKCGTDKVFNLNKDVEENCSGIVGKGQDCFSEGDVTFMRNGEENGQSNNKSKRKKRKGRDSNEIINGVIAGDNEMQFLDDKQERKTKKRKHCNEVVALKSRNRSNDGAEVTKCKSNEGGSSLVSVEMGDANMHSVVTNNDDQGKKMKKKEKLKSKSKRIEDSEFKSYVGDPALAESNEGDRHLVKINMEDAKHASVTEVDNQGKKKKKKEKLTDKSKRIEDSEFKSYVGDHHLVKINMEDAECSSVTEVDNQGKKKKKKKEKVTNESKRIEDSEFKSNGCGPALAEINENDPHLIKINMGDADEHASITQGKKKMKKKAKEDKRVTFSDQVEVFDDGLVQGKRFTPEEDEKIKEAVYGYIYSHGLGDHNQGVDMILHCKSYPQIRGCWNEIALALPRRPRESIYHRAHVLFERGENRKWTPEELEVVRKFHENHGANWRMLADAMGKHRFHVKDAWRRIKLGNINKGHWLQEEYQKLFDLVNADLYLRSLEDHRKLKHGMLRDNICWEAISEKVATRSSQICCMKWYEKLTSRMVATGEWTDTDDYRLINALFTLDACSMEEVDWDHLLEHRSGDVCRKRWNQMVKHIGEHGNKSYPEQVEILSKRYRPDSLEAREAFDNKPVVS